MLRFEIYGSETLTTRPHASSSLAQHTVTSQPQRVITIWTMHYTRCFIKRDLFLFFS